MLCTRTTLAYTACSSRSDCAYTLNASQNITAQQALIDRLERHRATAAQRSVFTAWRVTHAANRQRTAALQTLLTKQYRLHQRQLSARALHTWRSVSTAYTAQACAASAAAVSTAVAQRLALLRERRQLSAVLCGKFSMSLWQRVLTAHMCLVYEALRLANHTLNI
jgi:hypothetical protein